MKVYKCDQFPADGEVALAHKLPVFNLLIIIIEKISHIKQYIIYHLQDDTLCCFTTRRDVDLGCYI